MENKREDHIIYFKDLLFAALHRWRAVLAVAVIAAVVLGGIQCIPSLHTMSASELKQYEAAKEQYTITRNALCTKIDVLQENLSTQQAYMENSVFMHLNPYAFYEASLRLYVDTGYQIDPTLSVQNPDKTGSVLSAYEAAFLSDAFVAQLAQAAGTEPQYATELVTCTLLPGSGTITVAVRCVTNEIGQATLAALVARLDNVQAGIRESITDHTVSILDQSVTQKVDLTIVAKQAEVTERTTAYQKALSEAELQLTSLVPPQYKALNRTAVIKRAGIFAGIGFILGIAASMGALCVFHIISGKVYSSRTLQDRTGLKILGCLRSKAPKKAFDRWLLKMEGRCINDNAAQLPLLAASIRNRCGDATQILVTGSSAADVREDLAQALQNVMPEKKVLHADSIRTSVDAQNALATSDTVILLAQCGTSHYETVLAEAKAVTECNKTLIGCVVLDG